MKEHKIKFAIKLFTFLLVLILILIVINIIYYKIVISETKTYLADKSYENYIADLDDKRINYAFFGDSHTLNAINPEYINNSFNFGGSGENYLKTYYKLRKILHEDNVKLGSIILEIDLHTFSTYLTDPSFVLVDYWYYHRFIPYTVASNFSDKSLLGLFFESKFPFIGKGENLLKRQKINPIYRGWAKTDWKYSDQSEQVRINNAARTANTFFDNQERISNISLEYFEKTLHLAKENDMAVVLIKYPISPEFHDQLIAKNITQEQYYFEIFSLVNATIDEYSVLDYYSLFFDNPEYFADQDHVNMWGAEILSKKVAEDLVNSQTKNLADVLFPT